MTTERVRENRFVILLTDEERQMIEELAKREKLSASTYARRMLLLYAQERGIVVATHKVRG